MPNFYQIGVMSLPVVALTGTFIGMVLAVQSYSQFRAFHLETRLGAIINMSSVGSIAPSAHELPYAAAKAGLNTLAAGLARALSPSVRVNTIVAGPFLTDISKAWDMEAFERRAKSSIALRRGGEPEEIVGAAVYLASRASSFTTGAVLAVDGGTA